MTAQEALEISKHAECSTQINYRRAVDMHRPEEPALRRKLEFWRFIIQLIENQPETKSDILHGR